MRLYYGLTGCDFVLGVEIEQDNALPHHIGKARHFGAVERVEAVIVRLFAQATRIEVAPKAWLLEIQRLLGRTEMHLLRSNEEVTGDQQKRP